jgi:hypothetical protein
VASTRSSSPNPKAASRPEKRRDCCERPRESSFPQSSKAVRRLQTPGAVAATPHRASRIQHTLRRSLPPPRSRSQSREKRCKRNCDRLPAYPLCSIERREGYSVRRRWSERRALPDRAGHSQDHRLRGRVKSSNDNATVTDPASRIAQSRRPETQLRTPRPTPRQPRLH